MYPNILMRKKCKLEKNEVETLSELEKRVLYIDKHINNEKDTSG